MLDRFDSGMADLTTSNAVAIALKRELQSEGDIRVISDTAQGKFVCLFDGEKIQLPEEVSSWLLGVFQGIPAEPVRFVLALPFENRQVESDEVSGKGTSRDHKPSIAA